MWVQLVIEVVIGAPIMDLINIEVTHAELGMCKMNLSKCFYPN